jgi:hypothetical protein
VGTVTGTVTFGYSNTGVLLQRILDGFGHLDRLWGDSPATSAGARVRWFCNLVTGGGDQYGDTYTYCRIR